MSRRISLMGCCLALFVIALHSQTKVSPAAPRSLLFRTSWGDPDLQGVWNYAVGTPLERSAEFAGKAVLSDDEFAQAERQAHERSNRDRRDGAGTNVDLGREANEFWSERRPTILTRRTSLITDPPDGKLPRLTPEAEQRRDATAAALRERGSADSWEDRPLNERCLKNPANGPPMLPVPMLMPDILLGQKFLFRILQTPEYVVILSEVIQELRIIPLDGRPHLPRGIRQWLGDSRGRWEGRTLVVETTNLHESLSIAGFPAGNVRVVERFTRTDADSIDYQFTIDDPTTWTKPWTAAVPITKTNGEIYEFACHEGNYGLMNILKGARAQENRR
jgi:hypothetical protein